MRLETPRPQPQPPPKPPIKAPDKDKEIRGGGIGSTKRG
jgi:hypothetical protein